MSNAGGSGSGGTGGAGSPGRWLRPDQVVCAACGAANQQGSRFCERCGTRLPQRPSEQVGYRPPSPTPAPTPPSAPPATPPPDLAPGADRPVAGMPAGPEAVSEGPAQAAQTDGDELPGRAAPPPDATIVFRPDVSTRVEPPRATTPTGAAEAPGPPEQPTASGFDRDARTMSFETPVELRQADPGERPARPAETAAPAPATGSRDAQTLAFEVPMLPRAEEPGELGGGRDRGATGEPSVAQTGDRPPTAEGQPPRSATEPEPAGAVEGGQSPTAPPREEHPGAAGAPSMAAQPAQPSRPPVAPPIVSAPDAPPPAVGPPTASPAGPPPSAQYVTYPSPPAATGTGSPAAPPPQAVPSGQLAQAPAYAPTAYPAAPAAAGNRTLWIILGVLGGLLLLCALACVLLALLGAFSGAASVSNLATGVATVVATPRR